jgi:hypothetical protein
LEPLEARRHFAVDLGWSETVNGFTLSYELQERAPVLLLYGTPGPDVITIDSDADPAKAPIVHLTLNGVHYRIDAADFPGGEYSATINFAASGGAGDDLVVRYSDASPFRNVIIHGDEGNDTIIGGGGTDFISGSAGDDLIFAGAGNDYVFGCEGNDTIFGGDGHDELYGDEGDDVIWGESGDDRVQGWSGNDLCHGGAGNDLVFGDEGADQMWGGEGDDDVAHTYNFNPVHDDPNDRAYGGPGLDRFNFGAREVVDGSQADAPEGVADGDELMESLRPPRPVVEEEPELATALPVSEAALESPEAPIPQSDQSEPTIAVAQDQRVAQRQAKQAARFERKRQATAAKLARQQAAREARRLAAEERRRAKTAARESQAVTAG